ncbi:MAG TPA: hypothetical protein VG106_02905 [Vicinamibacterales bacterium]|nr:hypothetical protein [Vicinamibacterales bacterium]
MISKAAALFALSARELLALVLVFLVSLPAVTPRLYSSDEVQYFAYLRSLWFDRDVSFENEYRYFHEHNIAQSAGYHETFLERHTETGRRINFGTMGCAILWAPFYAAGDLTARALRAAGRDVAVDGFSKPYIASVAYGSASYGFLAILLGIRSARLLTGSRRALAAGVAIWIGTPILFYMYVAPPFSHACSAFAVALFVTVWLHVRRTWSPAGSAALGLSAALMAMVREQDAFFVAGAAFDFLWTSTPQARVRAAIAGSAAFAVGLLPQMLAYIALNGYPGPSRLVARKMTWYAPHALQVLASPSHGFFFWTPLAVLAVVGLVVLATRGADATARRVAVCALVMLAFQVYVAGSVESWSVAGAFGQRRFVAVTALLIIGLTALAARVGGRSRLALGVASVLCVWWNLALMAQFGTGMMDRQRLEPARNAYHAFVTLPLRAPELVWRYVTARETFYRPPAEPDR